MDRATVASIASTGILGVREEVVEIGASCEHPDTRIATITAAILFERFIDTHLCHADRIGVRQQHQSSSASIWPPIPVQSATSANFLA